jgi:hypothetical protein
VSLERLGLDAISETSEAAEDDERRALLESQEFAQFKRDYSDKLYDLVKNWALAVYAVCVATGLRQPSGEPTCPAPLALMGWVTGLVLCLAIVSPLRRAFVKIVTAVPGWPVWGIGLMFAWVVSIAECSPAMDGWKVYSPLDIAFAFEIPSAVLVAMAGSVTAGAVAMFVVVLKHYFASRADDKRLSGE